MWGRYDRAIITAGLSKAYGLPGLRIGWIVAGFLIAVLLANSQEVLDGRFKAWMQRMEGSGGAAFRFGAMIGVEVILITWLALVCASRQMTQFIYFNF